MLAGCSTFWATPEKPGVNIPGPPAYLEAVKVPKGTAETDARELALQRRLALEDANSRINRGKAAWLKMKRGLSH